MKGVIPMTMIIVIRFYETPSSIKQTLKNLDSNTSLRSRFSSSTRQRLSQHQLVIFRFNFAISSIVS